MKPEGRGSDMATYHLHAKTHSRGAGKGAGGHARYVLREGPYARKAVERENGAVVERVRVSRAEEVVFSESGRMLAWAPSPVDYWDAADQYERVNGTVYREIEFGLPKELPAAENIALAQSFARHLSEVPGGATPYTLAIHRSERDPLLLHCHLMLSDKVNDGLDRDPVLWFRRASNPGKDPARGGAPKTQARVSRDWLSETVRPAWAAMANAALERAGHRARIDHRSLDAQRIEQEAQAAQAMRRGDRALAAAHQRQADDLDRPPEPKKGRVLTHAGPEKAPGRAAMVVDFEAAKALRAQAVAARTDAEAQAERDRRAVIEAERERETRRQKLRELAELMRSDGEAKADLRPAYAAAGYRLEEREGKRVWVYPHDDLKAERDAAFEARKAWDARRREQKEKRLELDRATEQETGPGVRHPQRSTWQEWRAQTLARKYNPAYSAEMAERDLYCRWMPEHGGLYLRLGKAEVIDQGPLILAKNGTGDIPLMIETAQAKGWDALEFTGGAAFQEQAAMAALRAGLTVVDADLARRARRAIEVQDRREKLHGLTETLRTDVEAKMDLRQAYLAAGYVEQREGFAYPPGDLPEERKDVTQARKDWNERADRIRAPRERMVPKSRITADGAEYARSDGWKGQFTGAVIAVDESHVYVGAKGGGAPHFAAIPKERFKTLPSVGLYATFTQGDAQRPAGWGKVLGKMNGQGRLVRTPDKGKGIGD